MKVSSTTKIDVTNTRKMYHEIVSGNNINPSSIGREPEWIRRRDCGDGNNKFEKIFPSGDDCSPKVVSVFLITQVFIK